MSIRKLGVVLWALVLVIGAIYVFQNAKTGNKSPVKVAETLANHDGRAFVEIPWKRLPHMQPFELTEKSGQDFDSRELAGTPYVISFFFTRCPSICRDLNRQISILSNRFQDTELTFIGLSVDTKTDTPEVLRAYAAEFNTDPDKWLLMTGQKYRIDQLAIQQLNTVVDGDHHTGDIFLIDRWGRFRDRFSWDDPREMQRFDKVAHQVLSESEPPLEETVNTRNVMAGVAHAQRNASSTPVPWLFDFQLTDQNDQPFFSRDLTGQVWVASIFFTKCSTICPRQNAFLSKLQPDIFGRNAKLVSISIDADHDTPEVLRPYARDLGADKEWTFLTGDSAYIDRISSEFLGIMARGTHHSSLLVVVDRWGNVRARFDWQNESETKRLLDLVDELNKETRPVMDYQIITTPSND